MNRKRDGDTEAGRHARAAAIAALALTMKKKKRQKFIESLLTISADWTPSENIVSLRDFLRPDRATELLREEAETIRLAAEMIAQASLD